MHDSSVLDHVDVFWGPSCCDVGYDSLLKERPIAREANEEWSGFIDVRSGGSVPYWDRREVSWRFGRCCERKGIYNRCRSRRRTRFIKRCRFDNDSRCGFFEMSEWPGNAMVKTSLGKD